MTVDHPRTAVVVVAHRMYETLPDCLKGFRALVLRPEDLIFVDNGSGGRLREWAQSEYPDITILELEKNEMFCGGYNAGIRLAIGRNYPFVLIANADTEVANSKFLGELLSAATRWPHAAFLGPLVYFRNRETVQNTCLRFPRVWYSALVWVPFRLFPRWFVQPAKGDREVEFLNGVCVLTRTAALREIGLMDETFGAYVEDADWSWRATQRGWSSVFVPVASVIHHEEPHGYEHYSLKTYLLKRNTVYWFLKANKVWSARCYSMAAVFLARIRATFARGEADRESLSEFAERLQDTYQRLARGEAPGPWFGPPLGQPPVAGYQSKSPGQENADHS